MERDVRKYYILHTIIAQGLVMGYKGFESNGEFEFELSDGRWILSDGKDLGSSWDIILNPEFSNLLWGEKSRMLLQEMVLLSEDERVEYLSKFVNFEDESEQPIQEDDDFLVKDALMNTIMKSQELTKSASMQMFRYNCESMYNSLKDIVHKSSVTELKMEDFVELNVQNQNMESKLSGYLNENGKASFTVCPECGVEDLFT
jgi:hypothetical protein